MLMKVYAVYGVNVRTQDESNARERARKKVARRVGRKADGATGLPADASFSVRA